MPSPPTSPFPFPSILLFQGLHLLYSSPMDWLHIYIAGAAFLVFALVALVLLVSFQPVKVDLDHGVFTYLKFIWASFLKPHDSQAEGQQDALESFYKTQVGFKDEIANFEQMLTRNIPCFIGQRLRCHSSSSPLWS